METDAEERSSECSWDNESHLLVGGKSKSIEPMGRCSSYLLGMSICFQHPPGIADTFLRRKPRPRKSGQVQVCTDNSRCYEHKHPQLGLVLPWGVTPTALNIY